MPKLPYVQCMQRCYALGHLIIRAMIPQRHYTRASELACAWCVSIVSSRVLLLPHASCWLLLDSFCKTHAYIDRSIDDDLTVATLTDRRRVDPIYTYQMHARGEL